VHIQRETKKTPVPSATSSKSSVSLPPKDTAKETASETKATPKPSTTKPSTTKPKETKVKEPKEPKPKKPKKESKTVNLSKKTKSDEEEENEPNEYDLNDSFIAPDDDDIEDFDSPKRRHSDAEGKLEHESIDLLLKEANQFKQSFKRRHRSEGDDEDYSDDNREMCKYGENCYRKNPDHFKQFKHPKRLTDLVHSEDEDNLHGREKKPKVETKSEDTDSAMTLPLEGTLEDEIEIISNSTTKTKSSSKEEERTAKVKTLRQLFPTFDEELIQRTFEDNDYNEEKTVQVLLQLNETL
jgi:hypothetical protein